MHPLRFPNSGIRAKKDSEEEGRPATASPHAGPATHSQAGCKGQPAAANHDQIPLAGATCPQGAAACGQGPL
ncbi:hypothetical protein GW17_00019731 [Ensete ventricosum]|nr:hypothetical protein GW17_00019731 [Ensete ventricosum]